MYVGYVTAVNGLEILSKGPIAQIGEICTIKLPDGKASNPALDNYIGKTVVLGIRPEDIHDDEAFASSLPDATVNAYVDVTEMMGAETYLYLKIADTPFVARVNQRSTAKMGDSIKVTFDTNKIHLFDKETELTIIN